MPSGESSELEATARKLKDDGYNSSVVTRRMITEHGMSEPAAEKLVGRLYGKKVSARTGDTMSAVAAGMVLMGVGGVCLLAWHQSWELVGDYEISRVTFWIGLATLGAGASKTLLALINAGAKDDLNERRDDD